MRKLPRMSFHVPRGNVKCNEQAFQAGKCLAEEASNYLPKLGRKTKNGSLFFDLTRYGPSFLYQKNDEE